MTDPGYMLQNCPACGIDFDHDEPKCPDCGRRTPMGRRRVLLIVVGVIVVLAILIALWAANITPIPTEF